MGIVKKRATEILLWCLKGTAVLHDGSRGTLSNVKDPSAVEDQKYLVSDVISTRPAPFKTKSDFL